MMVVVLPTCRKRWFPRLYSAKCKESQFKSGSAVPGPGRGKKTVRPNSSEPFKQRDYAKENAQSRLQPDCVECTQHISKLSLLTLKLVSS